MTVTITSEITDDAEEDVVHYVNKSRQTGRCQADVIPSVLMQAFSGSVFARKEYLLASAIVSLDNFDEFGPTTKFHQPIADAEENFRNASRALVNAWDEFDRQAGK